MRSKVSPARIGVDLNNLCIGHNPIQTEDAQAVKMRFRSVFCKVLPKWTDMGGKNPYYIIMLSV